MWHPATGILRAFGCYVPSLVVERWKLAGGRQTIGQAELAPVLIARLTRAALLEGEHVVQWIDNDSARFALVRGYSPNLESSRLLTDIWVQECKLQCFSWFDRVSTFSNIGDKPSRLVFDRVLELGGKVDEAVFPVSWS